MTDSDAPPPGSGPTQADSKDEGDVARVPGAELEQARVRDRSLRCSRTSSLCLAHSC